MARESVISIVCNSEHPRGRIKKEQNILKCSKRVDIGFYPFNLSKQVLFNTSMRSFFKSQRKVYGIRAIAQFLISDK